MVKLVAIGFQKIGEPFRLPDCSHHYLTLYGVKCNDAEGVFESFYLISALSLSGVGVREWLPRIFAMT